MLQYESGTELPKVFQRACDLREIFSMQQRFAPCDKSMPLKTRGSTRSSHFKLNARKSWPHLVVITLKSWRPTTSGQFTCSNLWINFIYFIRLSTVSGSWTRALLYSLSPYLKVDKMFTFQLQQIRQNIAGLSWIPGEGFNCLASMLLCKVSRLLKAPRFTD